MNVIELKFSGTLVALAGYSFGKKVYEKQVKGKFQFEEQITVVFPETIQRVASSFVQGFFSQYIEKIGISETIRRVIVKSNREGIPELIYSKLM